MNNEIFIYPQDPRAPQEWGVGFTIGVQTFFLEYNAESKEAALWMAKMLRIAFENMQNPNTPIYAVKSRLDYPDKESERLA